MNDNEPVPAAEPVSPDMRDEFLAFVSHELRTPLTVIAGASRVLNRHPAVAQDEHLAVVVDDLAGATRRMERVIGNMLLLANIGSDAPSGEPQLVRLAVADGMEALVKDYPSAQVAILGEPDSALAVVAVPSWLRLILMNLLENAYQHGARLQPIAVEWERADDQVLVHICNGGDKVEEEKLESWFEPFWRRPASNSYPGAGLGLTVARSLARSQGGELSASPWENNPGVRMTLALPLAVELAA